MTDRPLPQLSIKEQRERTVALLCEHYAQDRIELDDFEARLDIAHRATTADELTRLLADLPAQTPPPPAPPSSREVLARSGDRLREEIRDSRTLIAIMGGFAHAAPPAGMSPDAAVLRITGLCLMGGVDIVVRLPGETAKDARQRQRDARRELRRGRPE